MCKIKSYTTEEIEAMKNAPPPTPQEQYDRVKKAWFELSRNFFDMVNAGKQREDPKADIIIPRGMVDAFVSKWYGACGNCGETAKEDFDRLIQDSQKTDKKEND